MDSSSDAALALFGLGMLIPLLLAVFLLFAGFYVLYTLSRIANALDRVAGCAEESLQLERAAARRSMATEPGSSASTSGMVAPALTTPISGMNAASPAPTPTPEPGPAPQYRETSGP